MFRIVDGKGGFITETYMTNANGWFSNTVEGGKKRIAFGYKPGNWQNHKYIVNSVDKTISVYVDGVFKATLRYTGANDNIKAIRFGTQRNSNPVGKVYIDNVTVRTIMPDDALAVETVKNNLTIADIAETDITLPTTDKYATDIVWSSSDADVIDVNGSVTRQATEKTVTLTATIIKGESVATKDFAVTVPATGTTEPTQEILDSIAKNFLWSEISDESQFAVTTDVDVISAYNKGVAKELGGVSVSWATSDDKVIDIDGDVTRTGADAMAVLTATFTKGTLSAEKSFKVYVPQTGATSTITEDFEDYAVGTDVDTQSAKWTDVANNGGGHARVMYDGQDIDNKALDVKRKTSVDSPDMNFKYDVSMESSDILVSMMFKLRNTYDIAKIDIGGTNQRIIITPKSVKIGDAVLERDLNLDEWYQITLYYNTAGKTFDAYFDAERFTPVSLRYEGDVKVEGITINDFSADRSTPGWSIDEITVRDISISNDRDAINEALKEIELDTTTIEWNIEGLPDAGRYGVAIEWISEKPEVLTNDGVVYRKVGESYTFKFTARASRNGVSIDKDFTVTVPEIPEGYAPTQEMFDKHMSEIPFSRFTDQSVDEITEDVDLITYYNEGNASFYGGATVEWSSDKPDVMDSTGKVTRPYFDECVTLTAVYTSRIDPTIKTTVTYKVTVWAEGTVIFREDFESVPAEQEGAEVVDYDDRFTQEVRPQEQDQFIRYRKDVADVAKPWSEANKVMAIERERGYIYSPERVDFYFPEAITDMDSVAVSFDYMVEDTSVNGTVGFAESIFYPTIYPDRSVFINKAMTGEKMQAKKWYTFTYVMLKSAGMVMALRDGDLATADYFYQEKGSVINYLRFVLC